MSIVTNNKFKSTSIYGVLNVVNSVDGNIISNTNLSDNLTVGGNLTIYQLIQSLIYLI